MTESEWLECDYHAEVMDFFLSGKLTERKLRLFAIACCQEAWKWLDENAREAAVFLERFVEQKADELERATIYESFRLRGASAAQDLLDRDARFSANESVMLLESDEHNHEKEMWYLLHDIFGNPFRPVTLNPDWLTPTVTALAQTIYDDRAFDQLTLLADELVKSGCANQEIVSHCRGPGPHVRGCWVVDAVLGKG